MEQIIEELPEGMPIMINRIHSSRRKDKTTQLWVVEVGPYKATHHQLMEALNKVKEQVSGRNT